MVTLFAKHKVNDYGNWKRVYDEFAPTRRQLGVTGATVHQNAGDPNDITITHRFEDLKTARAFADSHELKAAMANAGVAGPPEIWFTEDVEQTPH